MKNHIKQFNSKTIKHTVMVIQITLYACLLLFVVYFNQENNPKLNDNFLIDTDANIKQSAFESAVYPLNVMFLASKHTQQYQQNLVYMRLHLEDSNFSDQLFSQKQIEYTEKDLTELLCLALNIYFEARGEPEIGQRAVGHVVLNRVASGKFPKSICDVVRQGGEGKRYRCQFSWWCDGRSDRPRNKYSWRNAMRIAKNITNGDSVDPTGGALWYHADYVSPYWRTAFLQGPTIGQHIFYSAQVRQS